MTTGAYRGTMSDFLDPTVRLTDREPSSLLPHEVRVLQEELKNYRDFWKRSRKYGTRFVMGRHEVDPHYDSKVNYMMRKGAAEMGEMIASERPSAWQHLPGDDEWDVASYSLEVVVWPDNFFNPRGRA